MGVFHVVDHTLTHTLPQYGNVCYFRSKDTIFFAIFLHGAVQSQKIPMKSHFWLEACHL